MGLGSILEQTEMSNKLRLITSRKVGTRLGKMYSSTTLELRGLVFDITNFREFLYGRHTLII